MECHIPDCFNQAQGEEPNRDALTAAVCEECDNAIALMEREYAATKRARR